MKAVVGGTYRRDRTTIRLRRNPLPLGRGGCQLRLAFEVFRTGFRRAFARVSIAVARVSSGLAHGALHQTPPSSCQGICSSSWRELLSFNGSRTLTISLLRCADSTPI